MLRQLRHMPFIKLNETSFSFQLMHLSSEAFVKVDYAQPGYSSTLIGVMNLIPRRPRRIQT